MHKTDCTNNYFFKLEMYFKKIWKVRVAIFHENSD